MGAELEQPRRCAVSVSISHAGATSFRGSLSVLSSCSRAPPNVDSSCFSSPFQNLLSNVSCGLPPGRLPESWRRLQLLMDGDVERNPGPLRRAHPHVTELLTADIHPTTATQHAMALNSFDQFLRPHDLHDSAALLHRGLEPLIEGISLHLRWGFGAGVLG